jgi:glycosyltransferase involved in cell wall biosynthesis
VFNEATTITEVVDRLLRVDLPCDRELVVVDDGSSDDTAAVLREIAGCEGRLTVVHASQNAGKGAAIRIGLERARGDVIAIQDADLELDPADLAGLLWPILQGETDVVYGSRFLDGRAEAPWSTIAANRFLTWVTNILFRSSLTDMETCYKIMRADVARSLHLVSNRFDVEPEITAKLLMRGQRIVERPVSFHARSRSAGKKLRWRDGVSALTALVAWRVRGA